MLNHEAIYALYSNVNNIQNGVVYDKNGSIFTIDESAVQAKAIEIEQLKAQEEQAAKDAKASALAKLAALGLTQDEIKALVG